MRRNVINVTDTRIVFCKFFGMKSCFALLLIFLVYNIVHASRDSKKVKLRKVYNTKGRLEGRKNDGISTTAHKDVSNSFTKHNERKKNKHETQTKSKQNKDGKFNLKLKLKSKLAAKKNAFSSNKRQNILTGNPDQQRLFHVDETGTLHRHEVGPEEYTTPEGKTETFSNDRLLTEGNLVNLRPSQTAVMDPSTRQMTPPPFSPPTGQTSSSLPQVQAGAPVAFAAPSPLPQNAPRRYYLMTYRKTLDPNSPDQVIGLFAPPYLYPSMTRMNPTYLHFKSLYFYQHLDFKS